MSLLSTQTYLKANNFYAGNLDGIWGKKSSEAFLKAFPKVKPLPYSAKLSVEFLKECLSICDKLQIDKCDDLLGCMAFETMGTFRPDIWNSAGAPYVGLIQFGEAAATDLKTTIQKIEKMSQMEQLQLVYKFFKKHTGKLNNLADLYMAILYPVAVGKPMDFILFDKDKPKSKAYSQNKGLDLNKDGLITKEEAAMQVYKRKELGLDFTRYYYLSTATETLLIDPETFV